MNRRVVVTGLGVQAANGKSLPAFEESVFAGHSAIKPIQYAAGEGLNFECAAEIGPLEITDHPFEADLARLDRFSQLAVLASQEAIADAGLEEHDLKTPACGIVFGAGLGGMETITSSFRDHYVHGKRRAHPLTIPKVMPNAAVSAVSSLWGVTGPSYTTCTACASSNHAIGQAFWMIRSGLLDCAIAGGSDAPLTYENLLIWNAVRVVSPDTCRPFSKDRKGMILGEGAGALVLEAEDSAKARGARIYGEISGFGMSADAGHIIAPSGEGAVQAMRAALKDGGLDPSDIGYINAHGTGTEINDRVESAAIEEAFGSSASNPWVSSTKGAHGHAIAAAGALEAVATVLALFRGEAPPVANFTGMDPDCGVRVAHGQAAPLECEAALSNAFAFGGLNAVLAFRKQ